MHKLSNIILLVLFSISCVTKQYCHSAAFNVGEGGGGQGWISRWSILPEESPCWQTRLILSLSESWVIPCDPISCFEQFYKLKFKNP